jgi:membrane protein
MQTEPGSDPTQDDVELDTPATEPDTGKPSSIARVKGAVVAAKQRAETTRENLEARRPEQPVLDITFCTIERDVARGGGLMAGALAYRFFFWLLPFALVLVAGIGFLASADETAPQDLAESFGVVGFAAQSIADAAETSSKSRWWALAIGLPTLYLASVSFVKALSVAHALTWGVPNRKLTRKPLAALVMTGVLVSTLACIALESRIRAESEGPGLLVALFFILVVAGLWLFVSWHLPRAATTLRELVPGAIVFAVGVQFVHLVTVYYVSRKVANASSAYGSLGAATGILLSLFFLARVAVLGAAVNAELWARRQAQANE